MNPRPCIHATTDISVCKSCNGKRRLRCFNQHSSLETRFWAAVDKSGDCWLWEGTVNYLRGGYGKIRNENKTRRTHRVAWELTYGPIPAGLNVCHKCDVPRCVRPDHLFLGTPKRNTADMDAKGRRGYGRGGAQGESNGMAKLSTLQVEEIRSRFEAGERQKDIAVDLGMSRAQVCRIVNGKAWSAA